MKAKKALDDLILFSVLFVAAILFYFFVIPSQIHMTVLAKAEAFSPDTFPNFVTIVFIISSAAGALVSLFQYCRAVKEEGRPVREKKKLMKEKVYAIAIPYIVFALCIVYTILFKEIGVIWATLLIPPVILLCMKCRKPGYYAILLVFSAVLFALFKFVLQVPLH